MTFDEIVFEALAYRRHVGADISSIRSYVQFRRSHDHTEQDVHDALGRLEQTGKVKRVNRQWYLTSAGFKEAKGSALRPEWQPGDALVLQALLFRHGREYSDLADIIAVVDYIDHGIPTPDDLHGSLNRLAAGRLIKRRKGTFAPTERAVALHEKVKPYCRKAVRDQLRGLERILDCPHCGVRLKTVRWPIEIDEQTWKQAYEDYVR